MLKLVTYGKNIFKISPVKNQNVNLYESDKEVDKKNN